MFFAHLPVSFNKDRIAKMTPLSLIVSDFIHKMFDFLFPFTKVKRVRDQGEDTP